MPISWKSNHAQYVGRLHREHHAKCEVVVYDYVDSCVPLLARMALKRQSGYRSLGYEVACEVINRVACCSDHGAHNDDRSSDGAWPVTAGLRLLLVFDMGSLSGSFLAAAINGPSALRFGKSFSASSNHIILQWSYCSSNVTP